MVFWTVVFIIFYLASLTKGNLFYNLTKRVGELVLKQAEAETKKEKDEIVKEIIKSLWKIYLTIPLAIIEYIYLFKAINIDPYKYPSIVMLFYSLLTMFVLNRNKKNKTDLTTQEGRIVYKNELEKLKRYTFKGIIKQLVFLVYFGYMFYCLVLR